MSSKAPSRSALRHLRLLAQEKPQLKPLTQHSRHICTRRPQQHLSSQTKRSQYPLRALPSATVTPRSFSTTSSLLQNDTQPSDSSPLNLENHYTLFPQTLSSGPPPSSPFTIPLPRLKREFLQLQAKYHPDKFPQEHKVRAEALSSRINTAYKTLSDPLLRAQYLLLDFHGVDVLAEDQGSAQQNPETLMEVMEAQEAIEEASEEHEIETLKEENKGRIDATVQALADAIDGGEIEEARKQCIKLRFWQSLADGLHSWEPGKEVRLNH